jgi:hypothetical protein
MSLRHRAPIMVTRVPDDDVVEAAEKLRARHQSSNGLFRRIFFVLAAGLAVARLVLAGYAAWAPFALPHHAEAHSVFGRFFWLLEVSGAVSLALCAAHFVRPRARVLAAVALGNAGLLVAVALASEASWLLERGWWYSLYWGGFGVFFCAVTAYADGLLRDDSVDAQIDALLHGAPGVQQV